jgi:hypothetical protein
LNVVSETLRRGKSASAALASFDFHSCAAHDADVARRLACFFAVSLSACSSLDLPEGPDLSALNQTYEEPGGQVNPENVSEIVETARAAYEEVRAFTALDFVVETLDQVGEVIQDFSDVDPEHPRQVDVVSDTTTICPGFGDNGETDPDNGSLTFTLTIEASRVTPTIWGRFDQCKLVDAKTQISLDSSIDLYITGDLDLTDLVFKSYLFRLNGDLKVNENTLEHEIDFRILADKSIEVQVPAEKGQVVANFGLLANRRMALRARDRSFCCYFDEQRCARLSGPSCADAESGDQELSW